MTTYLNKSDYNAIPSSAPGTGDTAPISNQKTPNHRRPSASTVCSAVGSTRPSRCFRCRRRRASGSRTTDDPPSEGEVVSHRIFLHKNTANEIEEISVSLHGCRDFVFNCCICLLLPQTSSLYKISSNGKAARRIDSNWDFRMVPLPSSKQQIDSLDQLNPKPHTVELHMMKNLPGMSVCHTKSKKIIMYMDPTSKNNILIKFAEDDHQLVGEAVLMAIRQHGASVTQPAGCSLWQNGGKNPTLSSGKDKYKHQIVYMKNLDKIMTSSLALTLPHCTTCQLRVRSRSS